MGESARSGRRIPDWSCWVGGRQGGGLSFSQLDLVPLQTWYQAGLLQWSCRALQILHGWAFSCSPSESFLSAAPLRVSVPPCRDEPPGPPEHAPCPAGSGGSEAGGDFPEGANDPGAGRHQEAGAGHCPVYAGTWSLCLTWRRPCPPTLLLAHTAVGQATQFPNLPPLRPPSVPAAPGDSCARGFWKAGQGHFLRLAGV